MKGLYVAPLAIIPLLLSACATTVKPSYVSPTQYQSFNCQQLQSEYQRIEQYIASGVQPPKRNGMGVGIGLGTGWGSRSGWGVIPSISVNMGQSSETKNSELSRLLGQQEAIVQASEFKGCAPIVRKSTAS